MHSVTSAALQYIQSGGYQEIEISVERTDTTAKLTLTQDDIPSGGLTIDRYTTTGDQIEVGCCSAAELSLTLINDDGRFNNVKFEGAQLYVRIKIPLGSTYEYIPLGYFTVDTPPRKLASIQLKALDRMVQFDRPYNTNLVYPATLQQILSDACSKCNVPLYTTSITNGTRSVPKKPEKDNLTYRQIVMWIAELSGCIAYIDWDGKLRMNWYTGGTTTINSGTRFEGSDVLEQSITITGVNIVSNDEEPIDYSSGTDQYMLNIEGNLLAQTSLQAMVNSLGSKLNNFTYRPYSCETHSYPHVWPADRISYVPASGSAVSTILTGHTFTFNGRSKLQAKGMTAQAASYATTDPLTARQRVVLERMVGQNNSQLLNDMEQATIHMNEVIAGAMGLYQTAVTNPNGSTTVYFHDKPTLAASSYICVQNAGGYAWTESGWNNGNPVWTYGFDRAGNAIMRALYAYKITADEIAAGAITADKIVVGSANKNFLVNWDLSDWVDSTVPVSASTMINIASSAPVGGVQRARQFISNASTGHSIYAPKAQAVPVAPGEVITFTGWVRTSVAGRQLAVRLSAVDASGTATAAGYTDIQYATTTRANTWTKFAFKFKIPTGASPAWAYARPLVYGRPTTSNCTFACTGFEVRKGSSAAILTDDRVSSFDGHTYFDLGSGEFAAKGNTMKIALYSMLMSLGSWGNLDVQGLIWTGATQDLSAITQANIVTLLDAYMLLIKNPDNGGVQLNMSSKGDLNIDAGEGISLTASRIGVSGPLTSTSGIVVSSANGINLTYGNVRIANGGSYRAYTTGGASEYVLGKSANNNTILGDYAQSGDTNIYTRAGGRKNLYNGSTLVGSIRSDGIYNRGGTRVVTL